MDTSQTVSQDDLKPPKEDGQVVVLEELSSHEERLVELDSIVSSPYQPRRRTITREDVSELMASIQAVGQVQPIIISPAEEGRLGTYYVHAGHRRCAALRFLGRKRVRASLRLLEAREARKLALCENLGREDLSGVEQADALAGYARDYHLGINAAARELGIADSTKKRLAAIIASPQELRDVMLEHNTSVRAAGLLAKLEKARPGLGIRRAKSLAEGRSTAARIERELKQAKTERPNTGKQPASSVTCAITERRLDLRVHLSSLDPADLHVGEALSAMARCLRALGQDRLLAGET